MLCALGIELVAGFLRTHKIRTPDPCGNTDRGLDGLTKTGKKLPLRSSRDLTGQMIAKWRKNRNDPHLFVHGKVME
jgi:hypothetical protein